MPRKKKLTQAEQEEKLASPVNPQGVGEDPIIKAMVEKLPTATNVEGLDIANALVELLRGQKVQGEELAKLRQEMAKMDKAAEKWETDRKKFIEDVYNEAEKLRMPDKMREQLQAEQSINLTAKIQQARAELPMDKKRFEEALAAEPKEVITSPGRYVTVSDGKGMQLAKLLPEEIRIKHMVWVLEPYKPTEVPHSVAEYIRNKHKSAQETARRQEAMMKNMESGDLEMEMKKIDAEFHSSTDRL